MVFLTGNIDRSIFVAALTSRILLIKRFIFFPARVSSTSHSPSTFGLIESRLRKKRTFACRFTGSVMEHVAYRSDLLRGGITHFDSFAPPAPPPQNAFEVLPSTEKLSLSLLPVGAGGAEKTPELWNAGLCSYREKMMEFTACSRR